MTRLHIIKDTADFYSEDVGRRSLDDGECAYKCGDGRMCALGRYIKEELIDDETWIKQNNKLAASDLLYDDPNAIKDEVPGEIKSDIKFWIDLQIFHDGERFWNKTGLTESGKDRLSYLNDKYKGR